MIGRHSLVTSTIVYTALILFPILLYVFFYQESRIDEATMRNFRSLGTAADRVTTALATFRDVSENYSLGIDATLLGDIISSCRNEGDRPWLDSAEELEEVVKTQRSQSKLGLSSKALLITRDRSNQPHERQPASNRLLPCLNRQFRAHEECNAGDHKLRIDANEVVSRDCRPMRERDERVYSALTDELFAGKRLQEILDYFGIEVSRDTNDVFDQPTAHLSLFFDNYYIADGRGNVIFGRQPKPQSYDEHRRHRAGVPFASLATIQDLLVEDPPAALPVFDSALDLDAHTNTAPSPTGHSMVRNIHVGDVDLSVFIHPFTADDLTLYVVGAVLRSSLTTEAIRIRLGDAVDAMLAIAILITLLPVLRFWTAGDRSIFRRFALYSVCGSVLGASALSAALLLSVNSKLLDGQALDRQLKLISDEIHDNFYSERHAVERGLKSDLRQMERCADLDIHLSVPGKIERHIICPICPPQDDSSSRRWLTALPLGSVGRDPLTHAATHDTWSHNKLGWPIDQSRNHVFRGWWPTSSFLLTGEGKRAICKQYRRNNISLSLDLSFREYFKDADEEFRLYRIDSVVRGVNQIVGSIKSREERNKGRHVAVAIQKFWSIDGLVLPPYFQYAVVDEEGYTIFHSDEDRNSVANFLNDTGNDPGVRAAMAYEVGATLDAQYDGMPIRAHLRKLPGKENWTLVVFRSHMLVDQVSSFTSSFSIISWLLTMLVTLTLFGISAIIPRPGGQRLLPSAVLTSTDVRTGIAGVILGFVGVLTAYHHSGGLSILVGLL